MTVTTMTNDKQQATINPWPPLTMKHRKQGLGNVKSIMTMPIESCGAVHSVGNCITARAHWKQWQCSGFSNVVTVQQLWKQRGGELALATALAATAVRLSKMETTSGAVVAAAAATT